MKFHNLRIFYRYFAYLSNFQIAMNIQVVPERTFMKMMYSHHTRSKTKPIQNWEKNQFSKYMLIFVTSKYCQIKHIKTPQTSFF